MLERKVEDALVAGVKDRGGVAWKWLIRGTRGIPDRICFLPGGVLLLVELKRPKGGRVSGPQHTIARLLGKLGFVVHLAFTIEQVEQLLKGYDYDNGAR